jgi:hypothetical protein
LGVKNILETFEAWIAFVFVLTFWGTFITWFLMWYNSSLARIEKSGFWRSLGSAFFASATTYLIALAALLFGPPVETFYFKKIAPLPFEATKSIMNNILILLELSLPRFFRMSGSARCFTPYFSIQRHLIGSY